MVQSVSIYLHPIYPNVSILSYYGAFIETEKPTLVHYYQLNPRPYSDVTSFSINALVLSQDTT